MDVSGVAYASLRISDCHGELTILSQALQGPYPTALRGYKRTL